MNNLNNSIGGRLKKIRLIFNEGRKLSAEQFGHLIGESRDNVTNYESGRAGLPVRVLFELYKRGINPIYLISGEGSMFAPNSAGESFKARIESKIMQITEISPVTDDLLNELSKAEVLYVAAGRVNYSNE